MGIFVIYWIFLSLTVSKTSAPLQPLYPLSGEPSAWPQEWIGALKFPDPVLYFRGPDTGYRTLASLGKPAR